MEKTYHISRGQLSPDDPHALRHARHLIHAVLNDARGWNSKGYYFKESDTPTNADIHMTFATPKKLKRRFSGSISDADRLSICVGRSTIYFNISNWNFGAKSSYKNIDDYRTYLINHEVGHCLGYDHPLHTDPVCTPDSKTSVMFQQSRGIPAPCNPWPWVAESDLPKRNFVGGHWRWGDGGDGGAPTTGPPCSLF